MNERFLEVAVPEKMVAKVSNLAKLGGMPVSEAFKMVLMAGIVVYYKPEICDLIVAHFENEGISNQ